MKKMINHICMFLIGFFDSISLYWVRKILLVTHPTTKKIHPSSLQLLSTFKNTFIQVFVFLIGLPYLAKYFNHELIATLLSTFFLLLTFGYLFFYNTEVMASTKKVALWSAKFPNTNFCQFDNREKVELFYSLSNQVKSFIFLLLYYMPILLFCLVLISYLPTVGTILLLISQSFFNSAFYFLKKWPYDRYNVAFIEKNIAYMLGYGFFVSFVCNVCLSGDFSRGAYFIISQWMIINCLLHSPTDKNIESISEVWKYLKSANERSKLQNGYNIHRKKIRTDKKYRQQVLNNMVILKPPLKITEYLNALLAKSIGQNLGLDLQTTSTQISHTTQSESISKESQTTTDSMTPNSEPHKDSLQIVSEVYEAQEQIS